MINNQRGFIRYCEVYYCYYYYYYLLLLLYLLLLFIDLKKKDQ